MRSSVHIYQIRIQDHLSDNWSSWFDGMNIRRDDCGDTIIYGELPDQTALHGILTIIRDLGLTLVEVKCLDCDADSN